jgi:ribonuclease J
MSVQIRPIISDNGACVSVRDDKNPNVVVFDCGNSVFDELDLPPHLDPRSENIDLGQTTKYDRLERYFQKGDQVQAFISHAHYDHINGVRALNRLSAEKSFDLRIWATNFGIEFVRSKIMDFEDGPLEVIDFTIFRTGMKPDQELTGGVNIQPFLVCHSVPQTHIYVTYTSVGWLVYLGDYTFQRFNRRQAELTRRLFREIGRKLNPRAVVMGAISSRNKTNGLTPLETSILPALRRTLVNSRERNRRTIITHFGSNVDRTAMELKLAEELDLSAWLMGAPWHFLEISLNAGNRLQVPFSTDRIRYQQPYLSNLDLLITSGSQAEESAHLTLAAYDQHQRLKITDRDTIFLSARPIPGNEEQVKKMIEQLLIKGAELVLPIEMKNDPRFQFDQEGLISYEITHVSGHEGWTGSREALELLDPEVVIPFHGPPELREELSDNIKSDLPEIEVLMADEGQEVKLD